MTKHANESLLTLLQVMLGLYFIALPFSPVLSPWIRDLPLWGTALSVLALLASDRSALQDRSGLNLLGPALCFLGTFALSFVFSENAAASLSRAKHLPTGVLVFIAAQLAATDRRGFDRVSAALVGLTGILLFEGAVQAISGRGWIAESASWANTERITSGLPHPNDLAILAILAGFLPIHLSRLSAPWRWFAGAFLLAGYVVTTAFSRSRNLVIGLIVSLSVGTLTRRPAIRDRRLAGAAALGIVISGAAWIADIGGIQARSLSLSALASDGRIGVWLVSWHLFESAPLTGVGPFLFGDYYLPLIAQVELPAGYRPETSVVQWVHNLYLEALAERGVIGLAGFAVLVFASLTRVARSLGEAPSGGRAQLQAGALASAWTAFLVMGLFDLTFLKDWPWLFLWLLVGLSARIDRLDA